MVTIDELMDREFTCENVRDYAIDDDILSKYRKPNCPEGDCDDELYNLLYELEKKYFRIGFMRGLAVSKTVNIVVDAIE